MTFDSIVTEVADRLGLTASSDITRLGRAVNRVYKTVTSTLGIKHTSRRTTASATTTIGVSTLAFTSSEKLIDVFNRNVSPYQRLPEITMDELRRLQPYTTSDTPTQYAIKSIASDIVTIEFDCIPQTAFDLYADVYGTTATLATTDEPAFSESYHDVLIHGVLADEYTKIEKPGASTLSEKRYDKRIGELQLWIAVSTSKQLYQGKNAQGALGSGGGSGSGSAINGALSWTQTGLVTFDRTSATPDAPFAVAAGSDQVDNLDADLLDGQHGSYYATAAALNATALTTGTVPDARFPAILPAVDGSLLTNLPIVELPIGFIFISVVSTNPGTSLGYGTWAALAAGRVLVGIDASQAGFDTVRETGGANTVTLDTTMIPAHSHTQDSHNHTQNSHNHTQDSHTHSTPVGLTNSGAAIGAGATVEWQASPSTTGTVATNQAATAVNQAATAINQNTGGGLAHSNLQPYFVVYMFERTA